MADSYKGVMISSTFMGFEKHRAELLKLLREKRFFGIGMEDLGVASDDFVSSSRVDASPLVAASPSLVAASPSFTTFSLAAIFSSPSLGMEIKRYQSPCTDNNTQQAAENQATASRVHTARCPRLW